MYQGEAVIRGRIDMGLKILRGTWYETVIMTENFCQTLNLAHRVISYW